MPQTAADQVIQPRAEPPIAAADGSALTISQGHTDQVDLCAGVVAHICGTRGFLEFCHPMPCSAPVSPINCGSLRSASSGTSIIESY